MVDPVVKRATVDDIDQLRDLEHEARAALVSQRGGGRWLDTHPERADEWPRFVLDGLVHVAVIDDVVVGYLVGHHEGRVAHIDEVYITPGAREVGFGDTLIESAVADARLNGCTMIEGEALPGDRDTKNLFERAHITARLIVVARQL